METLGIIGDYIGTTIGMHSTIPYEEPDSEGLPSSWSWHFCFGSAGE